MIDLGRYEGRAVIGTGLIIRKTGDGLNEAMKVEPRILDLGGCLCDVIVDHDVAVMAEERDA